jgi:hypothetical protein
MDAGEPGVRTDDPCNEVDHFLFNASTTVPIDDENKA